MHSLTSQENPIENESQPNEWRAWATGLQRWGLRGLAAALLESGSGFAALAAQSLYVGQPLLEPWLPKDKVGGLARMLEDPNQSATFARYLRDDAQ